MEKKSIQYQELLKVVRSMRREDELFYFFLRACENGNLQICQICLDAGADINIFEHFYKQTVLNVLVDSGKLTTEVADWLIEKGADINAAGITDYTNLTLACRRGDFEIAKYFVNKGIEIKESDLYHAVSGKNYETVKLLVELGVDLQADARYEENPFVLAVNTKQPNIVEMFLQKGVTAEFYAYDSTPLHMAALNKDTQTARVLLKHNANVNAKLRERARFVGDNFALTPMDIAVIKQDEEMQKLLTAFGGVVSSKEEKIRALTESGSSEEAFSILKKIMTE